jgi:type 2 lantibiotic biosynthesis protein LanM
VSAISSIPIRLWRLKVDARWYLAQTLDERLKSFRENKHSSNGTDGQIAAKRLERWKSGNAFRRDSEFQLFLKSIDTSENMFKEILGHSEEQIKEFTGQPLPWVMQILDCLNASSDVKPSSDYLALVDPLIAHFRNKLLSFANKKESAPSAFQPEKFVDLLTEELATRLRKTIEKTLILETNIARLQNRLSGESKSERYASFIKLISTTEGRLAIYLEYPVLIRRVWQMLEQWYEVSCEFIDRFCSDYDLLNKQFSLQSSAVHAITGGAGDVHCQGRSVQVIEFANKTKLVYKPRSLAVDCVFRELLRFLATKGMKPDLKVPVTIDRGDYGWCEYIVRKDCKTEAQIKKFYERQGSWLALFHALGSCDLHLENLIASGEYPVVIDLETVFHPEMIERRIDSADELAMTNLFESVMSVGLLPKPVRAAGRAMDSSGLGAKPDQVLPFDVDQVEDLDSDEIFVGTAPGRIGEIHSNPRLRGSDVEVVKYHKQIKDGFTNTYRLLHSLKGELIGGKDTWFERFAKVPVRAVLRPTSYYGSLRLESLHPNFNRKSLDQDLIIRDFWSVVRSAPIYEKVISSERRQFLSGDIPYFSTTPDSHDIVGGDGTLIETVLSRSGREVVEERFERMSEAELKSQLWYIDAALQSMSIANTPVLQAKGYPRQCDDFLDAAIACGDRLVETAFTHLDQSSWVCLVDEGGTDEILYKLGIIKQNLYGGSLGIALFLAYLHAITGKKEYRQVAEGCVKQVQANHYTGLNSVGAYVGLCGLIYVNMHLAKLFNYDDLHERTSFALDLLPPLIASDQALDLISGCAGAIPVLLAYSSYVPNSRALGLARACGDKLLNFATAGSLPGTLQWSTLVMPRGFSHGTSGIAFALSELAATTNEKAYFSGFISALGHEAELFKGNHWTDIPGNEHGVAWCHGTAGIALSRLKIYQRHKLPPAKEEALRALRFSLASPTMAEHIICHGSVGNLEPLLLAAELFPEDEVWEKELQVRSAQILKDMNSNGWRSKLPSQLTEPGLMIGIAGIGYQFLRLHARDKVPAILTLDKPF